jgi:polysaccharide biosynthesis/export protein
MRSVSISKTKAGADSIFAALTKVLLAGLLTGGLLGCAARNTGSRHAASVSAQAPVPATACQPHCDPQPSPATLQALQQFNNAPDTEYRLGPGDSITITVFNHPELSGPHIIGPDGTIQIPVLGSVKIAGLTANQAAQMLTQLLTGDYVAPVTSIQINSYTNNQVTVMGDVANPGVIHFDSQPTLLEALAKAGTAKDASGAVPATKCAIFRGSDRALWLDLRPLFRGNDATFNVRLHRNDIVYVPYNVDNVVYVMGQVAKPGPYPVTPNLSVVQALADAGGLNDNANPHEVVLARPSQGMKKTISLNGLMKGNDSNYLLQAGDIVFAPKRGLAKFGYVMQQINPITQGLFVGAALF